MKPPQKNQVICGSNLDVVKSWPSNCIDSIVTDPPYGLGFMGKEWDTFKVEYVKNQFANRGHANPKRQGRSMYAGEYDFSRNPEFQQWFTVWGQAMLRITKPGGFLLCFGGTRTYHRLACAIEDAGWQIRDCMSWIYGSGFPKSHNISKAIDKKTMNICLECNGEGALGNPENQNAKKWEDWKPNLICEKCGGTGKIKNRGNLSRFWDGYGTALKPAWEPIIMAMKPLDGTFAHNAEAHGVAGLNIDGGRIETDEKLSCSKAAPFHAKDGSQRTWNPTSTKGIEREQHSQGRWPANLILDEEAGAMLDEQSGNVKSGGSKKPRKPSNGRWFGKDGFDTAHAIYNDKGGASRFFYCAKTSRKERNMGCGDLDEKIGGSMQANVGKTMDLGGASLKGKHKQIRSTKNNHPTVKPLALMKYLCTLLKMPSAEQVILDPFLGSGTTGMACKELGINFIGIEKEPEYCEIAVRRIAAVEGRTCVPLIELPPQTPEERQLQKKIFSELQKHFPSAEIPKITPCHDEHRQSIINAASATLRRNQNGI